MNHRQNNHDPEDFLDGILTSNEEAEFKRQLAASHALANELNLARELRERLNQGVIARPSEMYFDEVTRIIMARTVEAEVAPDHQFNNSSNLIPVLIKVAASIILFLTALTLSRVNASKSPVVIQVAEYQTLTRPANSETSQPQWELTASEISDMAIGISAVSSPGTATGLYAMTNSFSMRSR